MVYQRLIDVAHVVAFCNLYIVFCSHLFTERDNNFALTIINVFVVAASLLMTSVLCCSALLSKGKYHTVILITEAGNHCIQSVIYEFESLMRYEVHMSWTFLLNFN